MRHLFYLVTDDDECFDETGCTIFSDDYAEEAFEYANKNADRGIYLLDADVPVLFNIADSHSAGRGELDRWNVILFSEYWSEFDARCYYVSLKIDKSNLTKLDK